VREDLQTDGGDPGQVVDVLDRRGDQPVQALLVHEPGQSFEVGEHVSLLRHS
jgi:hypothetical protein